MAEPKGILDLDTSPTLTDIEDIYSAIRKVGDSEALKTSLLSIRNNFQSYFDTLYGVFVENSQTGNFSVTINENTGVCRYNGATNVGDIGEYTLSNNKISEHTILAYLNIKYDPINNGGEPQFISYQCSTGFAVFFIKNNGSSSLYDFELPFKILNPTP